MPDAHAYPSLKLEAKLRIRPAQHKDCLDLFAYVHAVGASTVNAALQRAGEDGTRVRRELRQLFEREVSAGVQDVVRGAGQTLNAQERALLVRGVLDTFEPVLAPSSGIELR